MAVMQPCLYRRLDCCEQLNMILFNICMCQMCENQLPAYLWLVVPGKQLLQEKQTSALSLCVVTASRL